MTPLLALSGSSVTTIVLTLLALSVLAVLAAPAVTYRHWQAGRIVSARRTAEHAAWGAYALSWVALTGWVATMAGVLVWRVR